MKYASDKHHRHSIRLQGYDYSQNGAYFVTICTHSKECLFGAIEDNVMRLNDAGEMVADFWEWLAQQYGRVVLDEWAIMPNHLHGIIVIADDCRGGSRTAPMMMDDEHMGGSRTAPTGNRKPIGRLVGAYKTVSTKHINAMRGTPGAQLWQRNYYEHVVRDDDDLNRIRQYIIDNPAQWATDKENPIVLCRQHT